MPTICDAPIFRGRVFFEFVSCGGMVLCGRRQIPIEVDFYYRDICFLCGGNGLDAFMSRVCFGFKTVLLMFESTLILIERSFNGFTPLPSISFCFGNGHRHYCIPNVVVVEIQLPSNSFPETSQSPFLSVVAISCPRVSFMQFVSLAGSFILCKPSSDMPILRATSCPWPYCCR